VLDFLVARYGEFVLLKPPLEWHTVLLWGLPPAVLIIGMFALVAVARRRRPAESEPKALTPEEEKKLATLVQGGTD
jgi:cytochrome c-type biogenesis protein CcmH